MAVVFISPKQRQGVFFLGITVVFLLILAAISFGVFLAGPKTVPQMMVFNKPKLSINMDVFNSESFKNLEPFSEMQMQYSYQAKTKTGALQASFISAASPEDAKSILENMGLTVLDIKEATIGRTNPFISY